MTAPTRDHRPIFFRLSGEDGIKPIVPVQLTLTTQSTVLLATLRPDLKQSVIAKQWSEALDYSQGAAMMAQVVTKPDGGHDEWGPCERISPLVSEELDEAEAAHPGAGFLLGRDLIGEMGIAFLGRMHIVMLFRPDEEDSGVPRFDVDAP